MQNMLAFTQAAAGVLMAVESNAAQTSHGNGST